MAKGGGGRWMLIPNRFFPVFLGNRKSFNAKQNFSCSLILGTYVHEKIFQIGPTILALKSDKGRVLGGGHHPHGLLFTYFSDHEDKI